MEINLSKQFLDLFSKEQQYINELIRVNKNTRKYITTSGCFYEKYLDEVIYANLCSIMKWENNSEDKNLRDLTAFLTRDGEVDPQHVDFRKRVQFYVLKNFIAGKYRLRANVLGFAVDSFTDTKPLTFIFTSKCWPESVEVHVSAFGDSNGDFYLPHSTKRQYEYVDEQTFYYLNKKTCKIEVYPTPVTGYSFQQLYEMYIVMERNIPDTFVQCDCSEKRWKIRGQEMCYICKKELLPTDNVINNYSTKVPKYLQPIVAPKEEVTFGLEIEVECEASDIKKSALELYRAGKKYILCKSDGSIRHGVEVVTTPATYSIHKEKLLPLSEAMKKNRFFSQSNCGVHIHVGIDSLSKLQLGKISKFVYDESNRRLIESIAGREGNNYCRYNSDTNLYSFSPQNMQYKDGYQRYSAINVQNESTIEFRIFASTTEYEVLMRYLDFVKALVAFSSPANIPIAHLSQSDQFVNYIKTSNVFSPVTKKREKEFPFLYKFLVDNGLIKIADKKAPK